MPYTVTQWGEGVGAFPFFPADSIGFASEIAMHAKFHVSDFSGFNYRQRHAESPFEGADFRFIAVSN